MFPQTFRVKSFLTWRAHTSLVPVQVGDVVEGSLADADPFAAHHIVNIHKAVS